MTKQVCVFYDTPRSDGWAKINGVHYQPHLLKPEELEQGIMTTLTEIPTVKAGYKVNHMVNLETKETGYTIEVDPGFRMPVSDFMSMLPLSVKVKLKKLRVEDEVVDAFMDILDESILDSASTGVNPVMGSIKEGLEYLVSIEVMTQEQLETIL